MTDVDANLHRSIGIVEEWNDGILGSTKIRREKKEVFLFFSIVPIFQYSIIPVCVSFLLPG
jgi:hypothetical protein